MTTDTRLDAIKAWLSTRYNGDTFTIEPASNDASFRRYFRVTVDHVTMIVMDAPPEHEDTGPFIKVAQFLAQHHLHVPEIIAHDSQNGFLLLTDLGSQPYLDQLNSHSANALYSDAIDALVKIQLCDQQSIALPVYDRALLQQELDLFTDWFLGEHLSIPVPSTLQSQFDLLINNAVEQPQVVVHRDYHSRNLMYSDTENPGIIDFQDAVIGPISYDLVSLLRDCYIAWPEDKIQRWIENYFALAQQHHLLSDCSLAQFTRWFDLMGLQRHIKVLGIFCRLHYRDKKENYMHDLPLTLAYVQQICAKYDEFKDLAYFLSSQPKIAAIS
jgi:aminoglycoside/choline kinase family phosphotransferase